MNETNLAYNDYNCWLLLGKNYSIILKCSAMRFGDGSKPITTTCGRINVHKPTSTSGTSGPPRFWLIAICKDFQLPPILQRCWNYRFFDSTFVLGCVFELVSGCMSLKNHILFQLSMECSQYFPVIYLLLHMDYIIQTYMIIYGLLAKHSPYIAYCTYGWTT